MERRKLFAELTVSIAAEIWRDSFSREAESSAGKCRVPFTQMPLRMPLLRSESSRGLKPSAKAAIGSPVSVEKMGTAITSDAPEAPDENPFPRVVPQPIATPEE